MDLAPVVLFVYNRPWHTEQTLNALMENELAGDSILYIYADGPADYASEDVVKRIQQTRKIIAEKKWCKEVIIYESQYNKGLANSVINGVTEVLSKYEKIIVLEDDLITSNRFLEYMNEGLQKYENESQVMEIAGFSFAANNIAKSNSSFFLPIITSWGWGTWKRVWDEFDLEATGYETLKTDVFLKSKFNMDNSYPYSNMLFKQMETKTIDSWAIRFWWHVFTNKGITLFPDQSLIKNIGFGNEGTHTTGKDPFPVDNFDLHYFVDKFPHQIRVNELYYEYIKEYFRARINKQPVSEPFLKKIALYIKRRLKNS